MPSSRPVLATLRAFGLSLFLLNFLFAQLSLQRMQRRVIPDSFEEVQLDGPRFMRTAFLGYDTFAADFGWIALVVNYGAGRAARMQMQNLLSNALTVRELDPAFYRLYDWLPAVYLAQNYPPSFADAEATLEFVSPAFSEFPKDSQLPFHAAMMYVGLANPEGQGPEARYRRIVELAELATLRGDPLAGGILPFYRARLAGDPAASRQAEVKFLSSLFSRARTARERNLIEERIHRVMNADPAAAESALAEVRAFETRRFEEGAYLSPDLFALVHP